jgi:hypothetical protein
MVRLIIGRIIFSIEQYTLCTCHRLHEHCLRTRPFIILNLPLGKPSRQLHRTAQKHIVNIY